jgi:hypothetical protein
VEVPAGAQAAPTGLYAWRTLANRLEWIGRFGGSAASERAVNRGLQWLARHQGPDGRWSSRCLAAHPDSQCRKDVPCSGEGGLFDMAHTGLTLLAFQAGGHYDFNGNNYSENVRRGLDWLVAHQQADGALVQPEGDGPRPTPRRRRLKGPANPFYQEFMYEHGMATFALAEACAIRKAMGQPRHGAYFQAAEKAIRFLYQMQHDDGGWRYTPNPREPSDTSVSGWQVLALKSAREAGLPLSPDCVQKARRFFDACAMPDGRTNYQPRTLHTEATTGVGMLARQFLFDEAHAPLVRTAANRLADYAAGSESKPSAWTKERDYYLWYNCTLAMFQAGGQPWKRWNAAVRDTLVGLQDGSPGCQRGSWSPETQRDQRGGRVYTTALATLCLEVYYRYAKEAAGEALDVTAQPPPAAAKP